MGSDQDRDREICGKKIPEYAGLDLPGLFGDGVFEFSTMAVQGYLPADKGQAEVFKRAEEFVVCPVGDLLA